MLSPEHPQPLRRLLYRSEPALETSDEDGREQVTTIVRMAGIRNAQLGLTGALLFYPNLFVQVLEGPLSTLEPTFERICCDLRHRNLELLELVSVDHRAFGEWSMAMVTPQGQLQGINDLAVHADLAEAPALSPAALISLMRQMITIDALVPQHAVRSTCNAA